VRAPPAETKSYLRRISAALTSFLAIFFFLLFPTFTGFTSALLQLALSCGGSLSSLFGDFVSGFAGLESCRIPVAFLAFALCFPLAAVGASGEDQYDE
jgi:hypothetical protein